MTPVTFQPITRADFPLLGSWLRQPHVARWWADDASPEGLEADYGDVVDGTEPSDVFIAWHDGRPVGLGQRYRIEAYPEHLEALEALLPVPEHVASIDYLLGPPECVGRGLGAALVRDLTQTIWTDDADVPAVVVPVHAENVASWRALERAGYRRVAEGDLEPDNPADSTAHVIYRADRPGAGNAPDVSSDLAA